MKIASYAACLVTGALIFDKVRNLDLVVGDTDQLDGAISSVSGKGSRVHEIARLVACQPYDGSDL